MPCRYKEYKLVQNVEGFYVNYHGNHGGGGAVGLSRGVIPRRIWRSSGDVPGVFIHDDLGLLLVFAKQI